MRQNTSGAYGPTCQFGTNELSKVPADALVLADYWLTAADTQEPGTVLYGLPGYTEQGRRMQLDILRWDAREAGTLPDILDWASTLVTQAWQEERGRTAVDNTSLRRQLQIIAANAAAEGTYVS